jgi:hypothetical protein
MESYTYRALGTSVELFQNASCPTTQEWLFGVFDRCSDETRRRGLTVIHLLVPEHSTNNAQRLVEIHATCASRFAVQGLIRLRTYRSCAFGQSESRDTDCHPWNKTGSLTNNSRNRSMSLRYRKSSDGTNVCNQSILGIETGACTNRSECIPSIVRVDCLSGYLLRVNVKTKQTLRPFPKAPIRA